MNIELRAQQDAHRQRPEHISRIHRILDRRSETDDRQGAYHAHAQGDIAFDAHDHRRRDQRQHHQGHREGGAVEHAAVAPLIDKSDDQADQQAHPQADGDLPGRQVLELAEKIIAQA